MISILTVKLIIKLKYINFKRDSYSNVIKQSV